MPDPKVLVLDLDSRPDMESSRFLCWKLGDFDFILDDLIVFVPREVSRLQVGDVVQILQDLGEVGVEQVFELFGREGEGEVVLGLVDLEHDAEEGDLPLT